MGKLRIVLVCLLVTLLVLPTISCSVPSKEFEATVTDIRVSPVGGIVLSSTVIAVYFDNGEVIPFSSDSKRVTELRIGGTYLIKARQTYVSGWWTLDSSEER